LNSTQDNYSLEYGKMSKYAARRYSYNVRLIALLPLVKVGNRILDLGSATADYPIDLMNKGMEITSMDIDMNSLRIAVAKNDNLPLVCGDAHAIPFRNESFDTVVIMNAFRYFENPTAALLECWRVLTSAGNLVILDHNKHCPDSIVQKSDIVNYYSKNQLTKMMIESGFIVKSGDFLLIPFPSIPKAFLGLIGIIEKFMRKVRLDGYFPEMLITCRKG